MNVTDINEARALRMKVKTVSADHVDMAMAGQIAVGAVSLNLVACYLLETGRIAEATALSDAAAAADAVRKSIQPQSAAGPLPPRCQP